MENTSPGKKQRRVRRCLFGKPDPEQVDKWLEETAEKQLRSSSEKWGYDFKLDIPVNNGDVEYEAIPDIKVPSLYKPCSTGRKARKIPEFDPAIPSVSIEEPKRGSDSSVHRPLTRSCTKQKIPNGGENPKGLKQAMLTNYLKVRKRRSVEKRTSKDVPASLKSLKSTAPSSPFRFVTDNNEGELSGESEIPRSSSCSPVKSPRKRPAQKVRELSASRLPKLRSHAV